jgi:hypothetical protein
MAARLGGNLTVAVLARVPAEVVAAAAAGDADAVVGPLRDGTAAPIGLPALHRTYVRMSLGSVAKNLGRRESSVPNGVAMGGGMEVYSLSRTSSRW